MKRLFIFAVLVFVLAPLAQANTDMAKQVLSQSTTNPFCAAGYDGPNPYEVSKYDKPDAAESICKGRDVIECYRDMYKKQ